MLNGRNSEPAWKVPFSLIGKEAGEILWSGFRELVAIRIPVLLGVLGLGCVIGVFMPHDPELLRQIQSHGAGAGIHNVARQISFWGDFLTGIVPSVAVLLVLGFALRKARWRQAGLVLLLAAVVSGLAVNCLRLTTGRPRPSAGMRDGFYGMTHQSAFHGFPSGHAATAFGGATALAFAMPPVGIPCLFVAGSIGWSRMELNRHYPTDILAGSCIGILVGVILGRPLRRRMMGHEVLPAAETQGLEWAEAPPVAADPEAGLVLADGDLSGPRVSN